ncbi:MAG TPA: hypothetical protein VHM00_03100 [Caldimonas sp.]|jgi:hypothetical protein|nr:hypothetical protein [Caldimonas sp.]HEX2540051.1 hypothetical protein [Caldimonas sp.]
MTPADIERVFGRSRLRMVTGEHVEVFREESKPGERRRYTKRFLATPAGDFSQWTEREWRILARLVGHGIRPVPDVVQFDRGAPGRPALVQTYDAGITVDHWATLLPLKRDGRVLRNVFEDCAHWWALARHCLIALDAIHELQLVHLDLKADNICIPVGAANFDPSVAEQPLFPRFDEIALIDFAFSLVSGESLESPLPIAHQAEYVYQSPRLLQALDAGRHGDLRPTQRLDWRCDLFSLAAMLWRYLPELEEARDGMWTARRHAKARALVRRLMEAHDAELPAERPHAELIEFASERLSDAELTASLQRGWTLALEHPVAGDDSPTPVTQIAPVPVPAAKPEPVREPVGEPSLATPVAAAVVASVATSERPEVPMAASAEAVVDAPIAVDPSDIEDRRAALGQRRHEGSRHVGWAAGLAVVTVAALGVVLWSPAWLARGASDSPGAVQASTAGAATVVQAPLQVARAPVEAPPAASIAVAAAAPLQSAVVPAAKEPAPTTSNADAPPAVVKSQEPSSRPPVAPAALAAATPSAASKSTAPAPSPAPGKAVASSEAARGATAVTAKAGAKPTADAATRPGARWKPPAAATAAGPRVAPAAPPGSRAAPPSRSVLAQAPARRERGTARTPLEARTAARAAPRPFGDGALQPRAGSASVAARATPAPTAVATAPATVPARTAAPPRRGPDAFPGTAAADETSAARGTSARESAPVAIATLPRPPVAAPPVAAAAVEPPSRAAETARGTEAPARIAEPQPRTGAAADFAARAGDLMSQHVPRLAQRAERQVSRVLFLAGRAEPATHDAEIVDAAGALARLPADPLGGMVLAPHDGRLLNDAGQAELLQRGRVGEALRLQSMAFGANPLDAEVAGNLALVLLRQRPAQVESARQLALHALTLADGRSPQARIRDWTTLAVASALAGRERDARNAWLVTLALAPNAGRQCKAAIDAYSSWGERLRASVEALLQRASANGRSTQSPFCEWPPHWVASTR